MVGARTDLDVLVGAVGFTDICGFTEFTALEGDEAALRLLAAQERIVRDDLPNGSRLVKELGDGLLLWFPDAAEAVLAALALQRRFEAESVGTGLPLWVRIGLHWGRQTVRGDDLIGHAVNVASRITDVAGPGEVVLSGHLLEECGGLIARVRFDELGPVVMKGLPDPVPLYRAELV